jgi:hypothetical protein
MDLHTLQAALARLAAARGDARFDHPRNLALALAAESGAVLERFKWRTDAEALELDEDAREGVARDAIEAMLYALRLASVMGVDVAGTLAERVAPSEPANDEHARCAASANDDRQVGDEGKVATSLYDRTCSGPVPSADNDAPRQGALNAGLSDGDAGLPTEAQGACADDTHCGPGAVEVIPSSPEDRPAGIVSPTNAAASPAKPPPAPSAMVRAATAALARAQAAAARVRQNCATPVIAPDPLEPPEDEDSDSTTTLDAGPTPASMTAGGTSSSAPGSAGAALFNRAEEGSDAPQSDECRVAVEVPERVRNTMSARSASHAARADEPESDDPSRTARGDRAEPTGNQSEESPARHVGLREPCGSGVRGTGDAARPHEGVGPGRGAQRHEDGDDKPHREEDGNTPPGHTERRSASARSSRAEAGGHGGGRHVAQKHRGGQGVDSAVAAGEDRHKGRAPRTDQHVRSRRSAAIPRDPDVQEDRGAAAVRDSPVGRHNEREHGPGERSLAERSVPTDRYPRLDLEAVQTMRKSLARHLEHVHRKDPLLRELGEELETLRRTLYSSTVKPAWIADTLLTIRRMLEESIGDGLGALLDADRRIAAIDALLA